MRTLRTPTSRLALGTATALLTLGLAAGPALADGTDAAQDGKGNHDKKHLVISPGSGGAGTHVTVKATCEPAGGVASEALKKPIELKKNTSGQWVGTGQIKSQGLTAGTSYPFRVTCADGSHQGGNFTYTTTPSGGAAAGFGGIQDGGTLTAALAIGGGVAAAGAAGYVLTTRRRAAGNHYY